jgi:transposase
VSENHPLRLIRRIVNEVLAALDGEFGKLYAAEGRASIAPERLLRALLLQAFYSIRSERQLMEQLHYNLLYLRWQNLAMGLLLEANSNSISHEVEDGLGQRITLLVFPVLDGLE